VITEQLAELVRVAIRSAADEDLIDAVPEPEFERPRKREHGDWATNVALVAGQGRGNPRKIAEAIVERLPESDLVAKVDVAGPGFLNFHLTPAWLHDVVRSAADPTSDFGRSVVGSDLKVNVEYISANPTGPMNVVNGRHAAVGDAISNLLEATGHSVTREYYINDVGRQMTLFARSIEAHYLSHFGRATPVPDDGYQGDYIRALAERIAGDVGDRLVDDPAEERLARLRELGLQHMLASIQASLERFGTSFGVWFSEATLHTSGDVSAAIEKAKAGGYIEEREGAVWLRSSELGDDKDRVVIKANGETTYLASDMPYLADKAKRGFDRMIYLWGADHHGTVARLMAAAEILGVGRDRVEVLLVQMVNIIESGEKMRASKRAGVLIPLDELIDEVGVDAARYTFLTRSIDQRLDFDIELVKEQAPENPVYYVQYAHARICSILRKGAEEDVSADPSSAKLDVLEHPSEVDLMRKLASFEEEVIEAALRRAPQRIPRFVEALASAFSAFYRDCKVISEDRELTQARLSLCLATKSVLAQGLGLVGVTAPERM